MELTNEVLEIIDEFIVNWVNVLERAQAKDDLITSLESISIEPPVKPACEHCKSFNKTRTSSEYLDGHCSKLSKSFNKDFWCKYFEASKSV